MKNSTFCTLLNSHSLKRKAHHNTDTYFNKSNGSAQNQEVGQQQAVKHMEGNFPQRRGRLYYMPQVHSFQFGQ